MHSTGVFTRIIYYTVWFFINFCRSSFISKRSFPLMFGLSFSNLPNLFLTELFDSKVNLPKPYFGVRICLGVLTTFFVKFPIDLCGPNKLSGLRSIFFISRSPCSTFISNYLIDGFLVKKFTFAFSTELFFLNFTNLETFQFHTLVYYLLVKRSVSCRKWHFRFEFRLTGFVQFKGNWLFEWFFRFHHLNNLLNFDGGLFIKIFKNIIYWLVFAFFRGGRLRGRTPRFHWLVTNDPLFGQVRVLLIFLLDYFLNLVIVQFSDSIVVVVQSLKQWE